MCSDNVIGSFGATSLLRSFELALPSVCGGSSDHTTRHSNGITLPGWTRLTIAASPSLWQQEQRALEAIVGRKLANKKMDKRPVRLQLLQWVPFQDLGRRLLQQMACAYAQEHVLNDSGTTISSSEWDTENEAKDYDACILCREPAMYTYSSGCK